VAADPRFDAVISDPVSGESQGLLLTSGLRWDSAQQMAARVTEATDWKSFDQWSVVEQRSWHHGRGLEKWDETDPERFYDSFNLDTRIRDQVTLAPGHAVGQLGAGGNPYNGSAFDFAVLYESTAGGIENEAIKLDQEFALASDATITSVVLRLKRWSTTPPTTHALTLRVETDAGGWASGILAHANATATVLVSSLSTEFADIVFAFTSFALSAAPSYHLVLTHDYASGYVGWQANDGYSFSIAHYVPGPGGGWEDDLIGRCGIFALPDVTNLAGNVSCFCRFDDKWYVGAGTAVYEWDDVDGYWVAKKADFTYNVTDLAEFAGLLWVAQSDGNCWTFDGTSTWAEKSGVTAQYFLVYKGYLYKSSTSTDNLIHYTADGSTWSATAWKVGNAGRGEHVTGLAGNDSQVFVATTHGLYLLGPESQLGDLIDQTKTWHTQYDADNGRGLVAWARDAKLYIPVQSSLLSYTDGILDSVGPDRDAGMPQLRQGAIESTVSLTNWLLSAINAGVAGTSSVLAYNGQGWHELVRVPQAGTVCRAIGYDTTVSPNRLWFGYGSLTGYVTLPDITDNPYQYENSEFASEGYGITPWWSGGLLGVEKDFAGVGMQYEIPAGCSIAVAYEVDRSGFWTTLYTLTDADAGNVYEGAFPFTAAFATNPTVAAGSTAKTINVGTGETGVLAQGSWVRVNNEVRQVASVTDGDTFVLVRPLSSAPGAGVVVYPSRPCGAEIRLRFTLSTSDKLGGSLTAVIYDGQEDHAGTAMWPDAATRVAQLHEFARRPTPFDLADKRGITRRVKVASVGEVEGDAVVLQPGGEPQVQSLVTLSLIEV
jgi:hypothetical protein